MLSRLSDLIRTPASHPQRSVFTAFALLSLACIGAAIGFDMWVLAGVPFVLLLLWLAVVDFKALYFLMLFCIPISIEVENLPGGFSTDFPSEQMMWLLTLISLLWFLRHGRRADMRFFRHPISLVLMLHLVWMSVCVAASADFIVSFKFLLAKGWYVIAFYFLAGRVLQESAHYKKLVWWFYISVLITVLSILIRHAPHGFSFKEVNYVMGPFYRNHVMYACLLAVFLPFMWYGTYWYRRWSIVWWLLVGGIFTFIIGINFAYTRAAYVSLVAAIGIYWLIRRKVIRFALALSFIGIVLVGVYYSQSDNWLNLAPNYERAVTHTNFDNLLDATAKGEDISTMERIYRWIAASQMLKERPLMGFGPGNFYFFYKNYTVTRFTTYVSDNPERSGMHNYYLMTAVEQGIPGVLLFIGLCFIAILHGERIFSQTRVLWRRRMLAAALLCFVLICMLMLINDFVETDKIGSLFFICLAIIVNMDLKNRDEAALQQSSD